MESIIQLLPDAIANQIAAGEVVQRPASVVKELLENAVDAGADKIDVFIKDAGKSLIQVTDSGCGMAAPDARMAFERHATSKIRQQDDLFNIRTLGFRGEALASIAAVAQVKLRSRLHDAELGTEVVIDGGDFKSQEPAACPAGSSFAVRNLFFNVPARRNFLKSNPVETRHILNEFIRVAIPNTDIHFTLRHNTTQVYDLPPASTADRLIALFGKDLDGKLSWIEEASGYVSISGYIGQPEVYRKNRNEQFFFVNNRFIKSPYLNHAISQAYQEVIPKDSFPIYCIFLEIDPVHVDINIHPTKTEVKFDDERTIYQLLHSLAKRGLGDVHEAPVFDFTDQKLKDAIYSSNPQDRSGGLTIGDLRGTRKDSDTPAPWAAPREQRQQPQARPQDWDALLRPAEGEKPPKRPAAQPSLFPEASSNRPAPIEIQYFGQWQNGLLLAGKKEHFFIIQQQRAHRRILYERFLATQEGPKLPSQQLLFPQTFEFSAQDYAALTEAERILGRMGFDVQEFGPQTAAIYGMPAGIPAGKLKNIMKQIIADMQEMGGSHVYEKLFEGIARSVAKRSAIHREQQLSEQEANNLLQDLFRCEVPAYSPSGKPVFRQLSLNELSAFFG
jgi:DNA mismatch repair protein MutL